ADGIGMDLWSLEDGVVVELRVAGQTEGPPVFDQGFDHERRGKDRVRPGGDQAAVQGDAREDLDLNATADDQPLDPVDAVQLGTPVGARWQVPAWRRRRTTGPAAAVQSPTPLQDQADGTNRGRLGQAAGEPLAVNGSRSELAKVTGRTQFLADRQ